MHADFIRNERVILVRGGFHGGAMQGKTRNAFTWLVLERSRGYDAAAAAAAAKETPETQHRLAIATF